MTQADLYKRYKAVSKEEKERQKGKAKARKPRAMQDGQQAGQGAGGRIPA